MKEQMRIELHNETEYTERISFQDIWTHASKLKHVGCRVAAITDRNSVDGIHMAEYEFMRRGIQPIYGVTLSCIDVDDRYDVVLLAANLTGRDNIFRLIELLENNRFSFGHAITREQLDAHRKGILLGAAAKNGQIVRAILHRRDQRYLETITQDYDYLEFTSEPYDIAATVVQLAAQGNLPLCAVQYAVLNEPSVPLEKYAYLTLCRYYWQEADAQYFKTTEELREEMNALYVLPVEKLVGQKVLYDDPLRIFARIEPMPTLEEILCTSDASFHAARMQELNIRLNCAMQEKYGAHCPAQVSERVQRELTEIDAQKQVHVMLVLADMAKQGDNSQEHMMVAGEYANFEILYLLGVTELDPLPRHIYCRVCGCWLETQAEIGESGACPRCGQMAVVSGLNVPVEPIHALLKDGAHFEIRASAERISRWKEDLKETSYIVLQTPPRDPLPREADMGTLCQIAAELGAGDWCREREFTYRLTSHLPRNRDSGTLQKWLLPGVGTPDLIQHLPTRKLAKNVYQLEMQPSYAVACANLSPTASATLSFLTACEKATDISASEILLNAQEVLAYIRAVVLREKEPSDAAAYALWVCGFSPEEPHEENDLYPSVQAVVQKMPLKSFADLTRVFSMQHGTGTWINNAESLLATGAVTTEQVIACREDVMEYLLARGVEREKAYEMMEGVRKGRADALWNPSNSSPDAKRQQQILQDCGAEDWFIESCRKIKYLFPRAHAAAFSANLIRIMWYCIHEPECVAQIMKEQQ